MWDGRLLLRIATTFMLALPTAALAQALDVKSLHEVDDDRTDIQYQGRSIDQIEDMDVVSGDGERIGEIEEVLANADNEIVAVVVEYDRGFLDLGEREVVMPVDRLRFEGERRVTTTLSEDELRSLEIWDD